MVEVFRMNIFGTNYTNFLRTNYTNFLTLITFLEVAVRLQLRLV